MRIPIGIKVAGLVVVTTMFYSYIGQLVPQKEVAAPEPPMVLPKETTTGDLVELGKGLFSGKGMCSTCHTIGQSSAQLRFPDLDGITTRAATRIPGLSALEYIAQSMYEPNAYIVEGFDPGMPPIDGPLVGLNEDEIRAVIAYLQTLGGTATMTMETEVSYMAGGETEAGS